MAIIDKYAPITIATPSKLIISIYFFYPHFKEFIFNIT
jgi:hypothetical protein